MSQTPFLLAGQVHRGNGERPLYLRLADALFEAVQKGGAELPSARSLAAREGFNRATVNAAYRELARRGLVVMRPRRPRRGAG
ncbi:MAG: GntR family transcriptional regulator, partial [Thermoanaerobaculaceae bacterium]|nr:GntR family transcriptional regulator [Thermoanaerobaculaceae bacterium]